MEAGQDLSDIERRLGTDAFRRRRRAEEALLRPLGSFGANPRTNSAKMVLGSPLVRFCFRLAGIHQRGYRQFLHPQVVARDVRIPGLAPELAGVTILHLSDLHCDLDPGLIPALARQVAALSYDLAVITGDFRNLTSGPTEPCVAATLGLLPHLRQPVYAVLGNHDAACIVPPLEAGGLRFLLNEHVVWRRRGAALVMAGVDDAVYHETHDLEQALRGAPAGATRVLLSHSASIFREAAEYGFHLLLAGHTHGGQICLPGGRPVLRGARSPRQYVRGAWVYRGMQGYTSPGTGACGVPLRFYCPAEITLHRIVPS
jgi:predicted MPP superfamily phosphohydrolase